MTDERYDDRQVWLPALYQEQWEPLVRLVALLVSPSHPDGSVAETLVRDAMLGMYRDDPTFHSWSHVVGSLRARVATAARVAQRGAGGSDPSSLSHRETGEEADGPEDASGDPGAGDSVPEEAGGGDADLLTGLTGLPHRLREVIVVKLYAGVSIAETADILEVTRRVARRRVVRALAELVRICDIPPDTDVQEPVADRLRAAGERVVSSDRRDEILRRAREMREPRGSWRNHALVAAIMVAALAAGYGLSTLWGGSGDQTDPTASGVVSASDLGTSSADTSVTTMQAGVQVFYLGRDDGLIYRELRTLPTVGDRLGTAVAAVLNVAPLDPEYISSWSGGQVKEARVRGDRITLDLSQSAFAQFRTRGQEEDAIQQLVFAATAAVDNGSQKSVRILVDGSPNLPLIGKPQADFQRARLNAVAPLWIDTPEAGTTVSSGPLIISGVVKSGVASPTWQLSSTASKTVVARGGVETLPPYGSWMRWHQEIVVPDVPGEYLVRFTVGRTTVQRTISVS
ncbi:hypothetical protein C0Z10_02190 [Acidipropionibacterium jensenii]|uniref:GerMN domain-containing protein n=1 Tax=Acidipropionibacterium jensenii TaxID=1749 RepID=A0A3T0RWZ2_9ACTN|nr:GerMN domain-containing protein [Acidipropionibacterium jensenii]AZZ38753.1 hypothetical protein C0Z10_02190 [Acidipropionibacterium jensenii]